MGVGHIRRQRGYAWEYKLRKRFNETKGYACKRLGSSGTDFPDLVAVNNTVRVLMSIECKSTQSTEAHVPAEQVERCNDVCEFFAGGYIVRRSILAFWFMGKTRDRVKNLDGKLENVYIKREQREFYHDVTGLPKGYNYKCTYNGELYAYNDVDKHIVTKTRVRMPFES